MVSVLYLIVAAHFIGLETNQVNNTFRATMNSEPLAHAQNNNKMVIQIQMIHHVGQTTCSYIFDQLT